MTPTPVVFVPAWRIRQLFNDNRFEQRLADGEFTAFLGRTDNHLTRQTRAMPPCTVSQMLGMRDANGRTVAMAHRYVLADGSIGESGKADPKFLFHEGTIYK